MTELFLTVLQMSLMAAGVTVIALPLRWLFRRLRLPALACVLLWLVVAVRMLLPVGLVTGPFSVLGWLTPAVQEQTEALARTEEIVLLPAVPDPAPPAAPDPGFALPEAVPAPEEAAPAAEGLSVLDVLAWLWLAGVLAVWGYMALAWLRLRRRLATAVWRGSAQMGWWWESDRIPTAFVFGFFTPRVYVPAGVEGETLRWVLLHERAHIKLGHHRYKAVYFLLAGLHWFNPMLWLLGAALCVPLSESVDALIFYGMGRSAGCPVKLAGCFDAAYIGEFYYKLGPAGAPVQLKLMYDAGMSATYTASIYTWKAVANTMVYTGYAVAALAYELFWRREGLGPAVAGAGALIALYVFLCGLALFTAVRPEPIQRLIRRILTFLARHWKVMAREGMVDKGMEKVDEFCAQLRALKGNRRMLAGLFAGMFVELTALFAIPFFLYRGLGLTGGSFWELVLVQCLVLVLSRIIMLPGNAGGAEGSFYLFMGPLFGRHLAVGLVLWRFAAFLEVLLLGGAWSVLRFAQRSAAGHGT